MLQIENEYGSFGNDKQYLEINLKYLRNRLNHQTQQIVQPVLHRHFQMHTDSLASRVTPGVECVYETIV